MGRKKSTNIKKLVQNEIKKELDIRIEDKWHDIIINMNGQTNVVEDILSGIVKGTGEESNRVGRKIYIKSLYMKFRLQLPTNYTTRMVARIDVVQKKETNNAAITATGVYTSDSSLALRNLENSKNVRILKSFCSAMYSPYEYENSTPVTFYGDHIEYHDWYHKFKTPLIVTYQDGNTMPDNNALFLLLTTDYGTITDSELIAVGELRVRYEDA